MSLGGAVRGADRLELMGLAKRFAGTSVLADVTLSIAPGEVLALLGRSGSGKTTLLRLAAGFESADAGEIRFAGERVDPLPPERRGFGMVFQHYALFPHLTVGENVAFGLETRGLAKSQVGERVARALARVDLAGFERRRVGEISGGQQQRVALARALAPEPRVLLLDEPLSNLDPSLRERTRRELRATLSEVGITTLLVTHEQEEAFELGDRVALLERGRLQQVGTPEELYHRPANRFVAEFVGRASFLRVGVGDADATGRVKVSGPAFRPGATLVVVRGEAHLREEADLWLRPEMLRVCTAGEGPPLLGGNIVSIRFAGPVSYATVRLPSGEEVEVLLRGEELALGAPVELALAPGAAPRLFPGEPAS